MNFRFLIFDFGLGAPSGSGSGVDRAHQKSEIQNLKSFTILEVMIAITIFFIAIFTILGLTSRSLEAARALRQSTADVGSLAGELALTNRLEEGIESGDFGELYPDYSWTRNIFEAGTNGLFQVDYWVYVHGNAVTVDPTLSIYLYRPESATAGGRTGPGRR